MTATKYETKGGLDGTGMGGSGAHWFRLAGPTGFSSGSTTEQVTLGWEGAGKVAIVTGAATGLGYESCRIFAKRGCEVIMAGRGLSRMQAAAASITKANPAAKVTGMDLDLSSLKSVKAFADAFAGTGKKLNILLLNAGVMACPYSQTAEGHEMQFGTNHLGHFLLTELLLPNLIKTAKEQGLQGRVVATASLAHHMTYKPEGVRVDKLSSKEGYEPWAAYGQSKLCNVLFARELNTRLKAQGVNVAAVSLHPGCIITELQRHVSWLKPVGQYLMRLMWKSIPQGAATQVYCCTAPTVEGGEYYQDVNVGSSSAFAHDAQLGAKLWATSEQLCSAFTGGNK